MRRVRCAGTNTSSTRMSSLPVAHRPDTCHEFAIRYSGRGIQKQPDIRWSGGIRLHGAAQQRPLCVMAAAGKTPMAAEPKATINRVGPTYRHERRAKTRSVVAAPDFARCPVVHQAHQPGMHTQHPIDPASGHIPFRQRNQDVVKDLRLHLVAAPACRLQNTKEARPLDLADRLLGPRAAPVALREREPQFAGIISRARATSSSGAGVASVSSLLTSLKCISSPQRLRCR